MFWGKVLGAVAGFLFARIPGAIIGVLIGHWFDRGVAQDFSQRGAFGRYLFGTNRAVGDASFIYTLFAVLGHLAKAKGRVTEQDIAHASALMDRFYLQNDARREAQSAFREGKQPTFPLEQTLCDFKAAFYGNIEVLELFIEQLIRMALVDGKLDKTEYQVLLAAAKALGFNKFQLDQALMMQKAGFRFRRSQQQRYQQKSQHNDLDDAYQILGAHASDSDAEIKKTYRKLMSRHHPDKLAGQGVPEQVMKEAQQRTQEIQAAYETIKKHRGMR